MKMKRPKPYFVARDMTTPDEQKQCWYYTTEDEHGQDIHGPFSVRMDAEQDIDGLMFDAGEIVA